jgi:plastocyanin
MRCSLFLSIALALLTSPLFAETATLKMRVVYGGAAPDAGEIKPTKDEAFCGMHKIINDKLLVNSENKGIQNAVMYVYTGSRGGTKLKNIPAGKNATHVLDNKGCMFAPHVVVLQVGDTLRVTNSDAVGHNANLNFLKNDPANPTIPPGGKYEAKLASDEPAPIPVDCNIHPWMRAYVVVQEHPYVGVSDKDGNLVIEGLPTGDVTFRFFHESVKSMEDISVAGKKETWKSNRVEVKLKAGENDLGEVTIPAGNF